MRRERSEQTKSYIIAVLFRRFICRRIAQRIADFYREFLEDKDEKIEILMENVLDPVPEPFVEAAEKLKMEILDFVLIWDMRTAIRIFL